MTRLIRWALTPLGWWLDRRFCRWVNDTDGDDT